MVTSRIPKIIHQSWKTENIPHDIYHLHWVESWRELHPDWEWRLWTDEDNENLVRELYPEFLSFYLSMEQGIKKADFSRFLYLHRFGGLYVDLDFLALKNVTELLEDSEIAISSLPNNPYYQIPNAFMASAKGNDFWMQTARDAQKAPPSEHAVESLAGPFRLQWALDVYKPAGLKVIDQKHVYAFDWINFTDWHDGRYYDSNQIHLAQTMKTMSREEILEIFPDAYCLTFWTSNW